MQNIRKIGAYLGAGAVIFALSGCADRNKNGQPDSPATTGEVMNSVDNAGDAAAGAASNAASTVGDAASGAASAAAGAAQKAGNAMAGAGEALTLTPKIKTALGANAGLKGSKINVDTLPEKNSIALRGTVTSTSQKTLANAIAKRIAPNYKIVDQLKVGK